MPRKEQSQDKSFVDKLQQLMLDDTVLKGGSKQKGFKISTTDVYQKFLAVHLKNNPKSEFLNQLQQNIENMTSKEDVEKFIDDNFKFY